MGVVILYLHSVLADECPECGQCAEVRNRSIQEVLGQPLHTLHVKYLSLLDLSFSLSLYLSLDPKERGERGNFFTFTDCSKMSSLSFQIQNRSGSFSFYTQFMD